MDQGFWREKEISGSLYDEPKRPHELLGDGPEADPLPNKKQALQVSTSDAPLWPQPEPPKLVGFDDRYFMNDNNPFGIGNDSSFGDPRSSFSYGGGFRKVRVSEVKESENLMALGYGNTFPCYDKAEEVMRVGQDMSDSVGQTYQACEGGLGYTPTSAFGDLPMGHSSTIISFGGCDQDYYDHDVNSSAKHVSKRKDDTKTSKKPPSNNFPPNVRSLLSTGILDGVPVKYIAWSRELPGVIKGSGYLCGCHSCNYSEVINAYEFERHAGCKTKHPNNHIYFENGKTIYGAVQELKSTPQNLLLDAIQTVAGSPINQESFRLWKVSFMAATRELKRIYGNDDVKQSF